MRNIQSMICFFFLSSIFKIHEKVGIEHQLPHLNSSDINDFIKKNYSVIIFSDFLDNLHYIEFGVQKYSKYIDFAFGSQNDGLKYRCEEFPCFLPMHFGNQIDVPQPIPSAFGFSNWLESLFDIHSSKILSVEKLRRILDSKKTIFLAVDTPIPDKFPNDQYIYEVSIDILNQLSINLRRGIYVFKYPECEFLHVKKNYKAYTDSPFFNIYDPNQNITSKQFFGGYMLSTSSEKDKSTEVEIAKHLAKKFNDKISLTFFPLDINSQDYTQFKFLGRFQYLIEPLFVLFNVSQLGSPHVDRWVIQDPKIFNSKHLLENIVSDIIEGKMKPNLVSQTKENISELGITANEFQSKVIDADEDVAVLFIHDQIDDLSYIEISFKKFFSLIKKYIKMYTFLVSRNDIPPTINPTLFDSEFPVLYLWKKGDKENPILFDEDFEIANIIEFMSENSFDHFQVPDYNETAIFEEIQKEYDEKVQKSTNNNSETKEL